MVSVIRDVVEADIPIFFEHQRDPEATNIAKFPPRDEGAFTAHWQKILANDESTKKTVLFEGEIAGNILISTATASGWSATGSDENSGARVSPPRHWPSCWPK